MEFQKISTANHLTDLSRKRKCGQSIMNIIRKRFVKVMTEFAWNFENGKYSIARKKEDVEFDGLEKIKIKSGKYAVFTTDKGGYAGDELSKTHDLIFNSWLKRHAI